VICIGWHDDAKKLLEAIWSKILYKEFSENCNELLLYSAQDQREGA
jgi:hypothetical protein